MHADKVINIQRAPTGGGGWNFKIIIQDTLANKPGRTATMENITCLMLNEEELNCGGVLFDEKESPIDYHDTIFWVYLGVYLALVLTAGMRYELCAWDRPMSCERSVSLSHF